MLALFPAKPNAIFHVNFHFQLSYSPPLFKLISFQWNYKTRQDNVADDIVPNRILDGREVKLAGKKEVELEELEKFGIWFNRDDDH